MDDLSMGYKPPTIVNGVRAVDRTPYKGSYVFRDLVSQEVFDSHPREVYIVYEVKPNNYLRPSGKGKVKTLHKYVPVIISGAWICPGIRRILSPNYLEDTDVNLKFEDFQTYPETADLLYELEKIPHFFPGNEKWVEVLVADLDRTAKGPCKN
jgi:hypothetical protein